MVYAIIAIVALAALSAWLIWRNAALRSSLRKARARMRELEQDRAIRQNIQRVLDRREAELRRLKDKLAAIESEYDEAKQSASDLNVSLFRESGLRILAEKEDGAKRLKLEQLEKQLADLRRKYMERDAAARATEKQLQSAIAEQEAELARLRGSASRRARRVQQDNGGLDQITLEDILGK